MSTALGVAPDSGGQGCDALTHRRVIASQWENTGVVTGLEVSGRQDLRYGVSPGAAVCSMGEADGMSIAWWDGAGSPYTENTVSAGDLVYPRIDAIYIIAYTGQPDNLVHVKVAQGEPSASPQPPEVEAGGLVIGYRRMPAWAMSTESAMECGDVDYAVPYGASLGLLGINEDKRTDLWGDGNVKIWYYEYPVQFYVPTDRWVELEYKGDVSYWYHEPDGSARIPDLGEWLSWAVTFQMDGDDIPYSSFETLAGRGVWTQVYGTKLVKVPKGVHSARIRNGVAAKKGGPGSGPFFHYGLSANGLSYPGRSLAVWDRGPAQ